MYYILYSRTVLYYKVLYLTLLTSLCPALSASHRMREMRKNFVPARVGILGTVILFIYSIIAAIISQSRS